MNLLFKNFKISLYSKNWAGVTCCETGYKCQKVNEWYSECNLYSEGDESSLTESEVDSTDTVVYEIKPITIWTVGDSTVSSFNDTYYYPRYGYGTQLDKYMNEYVTINNLAFSGESSKSFTTLDNYQILLNGMKAGDYLTIGFGHNDQKRDERRYTNPNGNYTVPGSFANSLYENYIKIAMEKGVHVILATPIVRRPNKGYWTDERLHITEEKDGYEGGNYPQVIRDLGKEFNIPVIDMTVKTKALHDSMGIENTVYLNAWVTDDPATVDNTHTNIWGAMYNAYLITRGIKELEIPEISDYVIDDEAPSKEEFLISNPDYIKKIF